MLNKNNTIATLTLFAVSSFSNASATEQSSLRVLDTTTQHTKHYVLNDYNIIADTVAFKMPTKKMKQLFDELNSSSYTYVAFSSKKLGDPVKKECVYVSLENEKLSIIRTNWQRVSHVKISNVELSLHRHIEERNCVVVPQETLFKKAKPFIPPLMRLFLK